MRRTKIICTIGPATISKRAILFLIKAGMNAARLNMSHGTHEWHKEAILKIREVASELDEPICILLDLQGPKIRVGKLPEKGFVLTTGKQVILSSDPKAQLPRLRVSYGQLHKDVRPSHTILLDDGKMELKVKRVIGRDILCQVIVGGVLKSHKGMNFPQSRLRVPALSFKDRQDIKFAVREEVDWIAMSFVQEATEVMALRKMLKKLEKKKKTPIKIMVKIEKPDAVKNFDSILVAADGIMIARGDLSLEIPAEDVPIYQKEMIKKCLEAGKPVVVATQMLESMIKSPRPTRAETSDVANAVIDHTDATMLSGETANGKYPILAVKAMAKIIEGAEKSVFDDLPIIIKHRKRTLRSEMAKLAGALARETGITGILTATKSGDTARFIARARPEVPIFASVLDKRTARQLNISWGIWPFYLPKVKSLKAFINKTLKTLVNKGKIKRGERLAIIASDPMRRREGVNLIEVREA